MKSIGKTICGSITAVVFHGNGGVAPHLFVTDPCEWKTFWCKGLRIKGGTRAKSRGRQGRTPLGLPRRFYYIVEVLSSPRAMSIISLQRRRTIFSLPSEASFIFWCFIRSASPQARTAGLFDLLNIGRRRHFFVEPKGAYIWRKE